MSAPAGFRRSESFPVRRWLQLGAASAGLGAALWAVALTGPQPGIAAADTGPAAPSSSAGRSAGPAAKPSVRSVRTVRSVAEPRRAQRPTDRDIKNTDGDNTDGDTVDGDAADGDIAGGDIASDDNANDDNANDDNADAEPAPQQAANQPAAQSVPDPVPTPSLTGSWQSPYQRWVARSLNAWTADSLGWIRSLQTSDAAKAQLEASFFAIRRTFFNQAPTTDPVQISGVLDGPMTGTLNAHDPDGDRLVYVLTRGPRSGTVRINGDGTFTYTPGEDFDGADAFRVTAIDIGFHTNLLEPLRPIGSSPARLLVNQRAVRFEFDYVEGAEHWTPERRDALQRATDALIVYFRVRQPVVLTYSVRGLDDPDTDTLASAGSGLRSGSPGFWDTVVAHKLLTGVDVNGAQADGAINWNFGYGWGLGETVGADEFDFRTVAMHELLHSFGFLSYTEEPGANDDRRWATLDRYLVTATGQRPIGRDYRWDSSFDEYLVGADGGLYFGGRHAVAAYGGYVPLFTPGPWEDGSSGSHTDDQTFQGLDRLLMNAKVATGPGVRTLSAVEIGILRDLGYTVVPVSAL